MQVPPEVTPQAISLSLANFGLDLHLIQIGAIHLRVRLQEHVGRHAKEGPISHLGILDEFVLLVELILDMLFFFSLMLSRIK